MIAQINVNGPGEIISLIIALVVVGGGFFLGGQLLRGQGRTVEYHARRRSPRNLIDRAPNADDLEANERVRKLEDHRRCGCPICLEIVAAEETAEPTTH